MEFAIYLTQGEILCQKLIISINKIRNISVKTQ